MFTYYIPLLVILTLGIAGIGLTAYAIKFIEGQDK